MNLVQSRPHLVSFGDSRLKKATRRFRRQAKQLRVFSSVHVNNQSDLHKEFALRNGEILKSSVRGFGYWSWKPQIILQRLSELPEGTILFYSDVGFHINWRGRRRFQHWVNQFEKAPDWILVFQALPPRDFPVHDGRPLPDLADGIWCKGDLVDHFSMRQNPDLWTPTIGAGLFAVKNTSAARSFLREWRRVGEEQPNLLDDSTSIAPNPEGFREHRHDQSLFSLALKTQNLGLRLSAFEYWYPKNNGRGADWRALRSSPFLAKRDLGKKQGGFDRAKAFLGKIWQRRR